MCVGLIKKQELKKKERERTEWYVYMTYDMNPLHIHTVHTILKKISMWGARV